MAGKKPVSRLEFFALCEDHFRRDGFVKWTAIANELGVTRQAVAARLEKAVRLGHLSEDDYKRWAGTKARAVFSKEREADRVDKKQRTMTTLLTPENHAWIYAYCEKNHMRTGEFINNLVTKAREEVSK